jgi:polysaccharide biosynthesis protein
MKIDQVMIQDMLGSEAVGQYAAATRLSEIWYFIPTILVSSLFPAIVNARKQSEELYYSRLQKLFDLVVWIAIVIALPMTFLSDMIVDILYGKQYSQAASVLMIHIWASIFVFLGVISSNWYINENLQLLAFLRAFYGMISNIFLNLLLITKYGIQGAAIATLISYMIVDFICDVVNCYSRRIFFMKLNTINPMRIW